MYLKWKMSYFEKRIKSLKFVIVVNIIGVLFCLTAFVTNLISGHSFWCLIQLTFVLLNSWLLFNNVKSLNKTKLDFTKNLLRYGE